MSPKSEEPQSHNLPQAGRIQFFLQKWREITQDKWILDTVQGFRLPFIQEPPQTRLPQFAFSQEESQTITQEIESLVKKGAIQASDAEEEGSVREGGG